MEKCKKKIKRSLFFLVKKSGVISLNWPNTGICIHSAEKKKREFLKFFYTMRSVRLECLTFRFETEDFTSEHSILDYITAILIGYNLSHFVTFPIKSVTKWFENELNTQSVV